MRVAAFVSGGLVPPEVRGTSNNFRIHIVDWYPTICRLVNVDASDDSPGEHLRALLVPRMALPRRHV